MQISRKFFLVITILFSSGASILFASHSPLNLVIPYDRFVTPSYAPHYRVQLNAYGEWGMKPAHALTQNGNQANPLQVWSGVQDTIAMLEGAPLNSPITALRNKIGPVDDINSGKIIIKGKLKEEGSFVGMLRARLYRCWYLGIYVPVYAYTLSDIQTEDLTPSTTQTDRLIKQLLTNNLVNITQTFGDLEIGPWSRSGIGDSTFLVEWYQEFPQQRPLLKKASVQWRAGLTVPTGRRENIHKLLAFAFGNNGSCAIPFGAGLDIQLGSYLHCGFDVLLIHTFGQTRNTRIKTAANQTEPFLLNVGQVFIDYGLMQRFILYGTIQDLIPGVELVAGYHFFKQGSDEITVRGNVFLTSDAQTAASLSERTMHHFIGKASYNYSWRTKCDTTGAVFLRIPFNGKNVIVNPAVGLSLTVAF